MNGVRIQLDSPSVGEVAENADLALVIDRNHDTGGRDLQGADFFVTNCNLHRPRLPCLGNRHGRTPLGSADQSSIGCHLQDRRFGTGDVDAAARGGSDAQVGDLSHRDLHRLGSNDQGVDGCRGNDLETAFASGWTEPDSQATPAELVGLKRCGLHVGHVAGLNDQ